MGRQVAKVFECYFRFNPPKFTTAIFIIMSLFDFSFLVCGLRSGNDD